uniref:Uncharacterized protein n=1 Tax=Arundo donax TaxID=35708 RepID=A0A0A9EZJ0_ARUDO
MKFPYFCSDNNCLFMLITTNTNQGFMILQPSHELRHNECMPIQQMVEMSSLKEAFFPHHFTDEGACEDEPEDPDYVEGLEDDFGEDKS